MAPRLSAVPGERDVQVYMAAIGAALVVALLAFQGLGIWASAALGGNPPQGEVDRFVRQHHGDAVKLAGAGLVTVVSLLLPWTIWRRRPALRTVGELRSRTAFGVGLFGALMPVVAAWGAMAVHVLCLVWLLTIKVDSNPTQHVEGGSYG